MSIPAVERKNILDLFPYFSKYPITVDVGANKGEWSEVLINNVEDAILIEPNHDLACFMAVKFEYRAAIFEVAAMDYVGRVKLNRFMNNNTGLSSVFKNPKWKDLHSIEVDVEAVRLDRMLEPLPHVDFMKIDVEGADLLALHGAEKMLESNKIKFIQVEKSEHLHLAGHTFEDVIKYLEKFGYKPIETEDMENVIFAQGDFTQNWNSEFKKNTKGIKVDTALEIGCFEGLTSRYICDNLLNPGGRLVCVDPLTDEYLPGHKDNEMFKGQFDRFTRNTKGYPIELIRKRSEDAYDQLKDIRFGLIYIDGDHTEAGVFYDAVHYWNLLHEDGTGYMLFDDYGQSEETKRGIDRFIETQKDNLEILVKDYQVLIRRIK